MHYCVYRINSTINSKQQKQQKSNQLNKAQSDYSLYRGLDTLYGLAHNSSVKIC